LGEAIGFGNKFIKGGFIGHPKEDENAASDANGKPGNINERIESAFKKISDSNEEVISEHNNGGNAGNTPRQEEGCMKIMQIF
jgi:hypothetical protein